MLRSVVRLYYILAYKRLYKYHVLVRSGPIDFVFLQPRMSLKRPCFNHNIYSRGGACGLYCFDARGIIVRPKSLHPRHASPILSRSWHPYCRRSFRNKIQKLLLTCQWPEFSVFISGPTVKGFAEPGSVFRNCRTLYSSRSCCAWALRGLHDQACAATLRVVYVTR